MRGDGAHVPNHRALGVEIGGDDEQAPAALVGGGDIGEQGRRDLFGDQILERPGIDKTLAGATDLENVGRRDLGIGGAQCVVIARPGKDERRHQRAGAHAGDHRIIRPIAGLAQAVEQAGAECAIGAAARQREPRPGLRRQGGGKVRNRIRPKTRVRHAGNCRGNLIGGRERDARRQLFRLGLRLSRRRFGRCSFVGRCFMRRWAAILVSRRLCRERRRHKQPHRKDRNSRISIPSCYVCHNLIAPCRIGCPEINGRFGSRSVPFAKHDGPKNRGPRRSANRAVLRQDQSGPSSFGL